MHEAEIPLQRFLMSRVVEEACVQGTAQSRGFQGFLTHPMIRSTRSFQYRRDSDLQLGKVFHTSNTCVDSLRMSMTLALGLAEASRRSPPYP